MKLLHWFALIIVPLAGCQSYPDSYATPYDNPYNLLPPGTVIELHQTLSFSPNNSRSNIQNGKAIGQGRYNRFTPMCQFYLYESRNAMKVSRSVEPDRFTVVKASQHIDYTLGEPFQLAYVGVGIGGPRYFGSPFDDGIGTRTMTTTMRLHSEKQPQVYELRCMLDDDPYLRHFVSINQMIKTLGEVATIHLPVVAQ